MNVRCKFERYIAVFIEYLLQKKLMLTVATPTVADDKGGARAPKAPPLPTPLLDAPSETMPDDPYDPYDQYLSDEETRSVYENEEEQEQGESNTI
jgi:hypothetical protein